MSNIARVILITGGGSGIGKAAVEKFLENGDLVCACDINENNLKWLEDTFGNDNLFAYNLDVSNVENCNKVIEDIIRQHSKIDVLVNCAGISIIGPVEDMDESQWDKMTDVNLKGTFFMCRYSIPYLAESHGSIVNMSSCSGILGGTDEVIYSATKGGIITLTKALAVELAPHNIRVNTICPGDVNTEMFAANAELCANGNRAKFEAELLAEYPGGENARLATPEEIAEIVFFLSNPSVGIINGAVISADGGFSAGY